MKINCPQKDGDNDYKYFTFPAGEPHLQLDKSLVSNFLDNFINIEFNFKESKHIFELLLLSHTLNIYGKSIDNLIIPYLPFGQADRINEIGECFSLKLFCQLINEVIKPERVIIFDPHSDVGPALLNNVHVVPQWEILALIIKSIYPNTKPSFYLISPDGGALKKIHKLAALVNPIWVVSCEKIRDTSTGNITGTEVNFEDFGEADCIIADDCVVGGKTYIEIAKILKQRNAGKIILITTHGIYSKGIDVFYGLFDAIYNRNGLVKQFDYNFKG